MLLNHADLTAATLWRLSARRQPSAGAAWLAEPMFPIHVYGYDSSARCLSLFYNEPAGGAGDLPVTKAPLSPSIRLQPREGTWSVGAALIGPKRTQ
jgi:hypothetical protein